MLASGRLRRAADAASRGHNGSLGICALNFTKCQRAGLDWRSASALRHLYDDMANVALLATPEDVSGLFFSEDRR